MADKVFPAVAEMALDFGVAAFVVGSVRVGSVSVLSVDEGASVGASSA